MKPLHKTPFSAWLTGEGRVMELCSSEPFKFRHLVYRLIRWTLALLAAAALVFLLVIFPGMVRPTGVSVPILLYHEIDAAGHGRSCISEAVFLEHLDAIQQAGYETVTIDDLIAYVEEGTELPDQPVLITFDDGYLSNYEIAYPALAERGMKATIFVIGSSVGRDTYQGTDIPITPHFSYDQAREMVESGVISVQSHTYDMHHYQPLVDPEVFRLGVLSRADEAPGDYWTALYDDFAYSAAQLKEGAGEPVTALAYPFGRYTEDSEDACSALGIPVTLTIKPRHARLVQGEPDSLRLLGRYDTDECPAADLLALLESGSNFFTRLQLALEDSAWATVRWSGWPR